MPRTTKATTFAAQTATVVTGGAGQITVTLDASGFTVTVDTLATSAHATSTAAGSYQPGDKVLIMYFPHMQPAPVAVGVYTAGPTYQ